MLGVLFFFFTGISVTDNEVKLTAGLLIVMGSGKVLILTSLEYYVRGKQEHMNMRGFTSSPSKCMSSTYGGVTRLQD